MNRGSCYGISHQSHSSQPFYGRSRSPSHQDITFTPVLWKRFVDDTFIIIKKQHKNSFLGYLNSINPSIKFSSEETRTDGSMPFLDFLITPKEDGSLQTSVYRKPTHTDLYLQWDSHHTIPSKTVWWAHCTIEPKQSALTKMCCTRKNNIFLQALENCKYPTWALNRVKMRS